jgi:hypothetical protein
MLPHRTNETNSKDKTLIDLDLELMTALESMRVAADMYFDDNACRADNNNYAKYRAFYEAYVQLSEQLSHPQLFLSSKSDDTETKEIIRSAIAIATDTTHLFQTLAKKPETGDSSYSPQIEQARKAGAISIYKSKYPSSAVNCLKTVGRVVATFCAAALGFVVGAAIGAIVMFFVSAFALPVGAGFAATIPGIIGGALVGGICTGVGAGSLTWQSPCWQKKPKERLEAKAGSFAKHAAAFFPPPRVEIYDAHFTPPAPQPNQTKTPTGNYSPQASR